MHTHIHTYTAHTIVGGYTIVGGLGDHQGIPPAPTIRRSLGDIMERQQSCLIIIIIIIIKAALFKSDRIAILSEFM